jgi:hypothetical protein
MDNDLPQWEQIFARCCLGAIAPLSSSFLFSVLLIFLVDAPKVGGCDYALRGQHRRQLQDAMWQR